MNLPYWMLWYTTSYTLRNEQTTRGLGGGERKNSPNFIIDHPYTPRKPPACSNSNNTTISQINQKDSLLWYSKIDTSINEQSKTQKKRKKKKTLPIFNRPHLYSMQATCLLQFKQPPQAILSLCSSYHIYHKVL